MYKNNQQVNLSPKWVTGFTDAEGNSSINYSKPSGKIGVSFKVTQKNHSVNVLFALKEYFGCGEVYTNNKKNDASKFQVSRKKDIINNIISYFDKYPIVSFKL